MRKFIRHQNHLILFKEHLGFSNWILGNLIQLRSSMISYSEQNGARNAMVSIMIGNLGLEKNVTEDSVNEKITPNLTISDQLSFV